MKKTIFFLTCVMISTTALAQLQKKLDSLIAVHVTESGPGIGLLVENNGKILYKKAFGRETEKGSPLTPATNFRMASVSKQFTAMSLVLLEKEGKLSFDDPIGRFFPELPGSLGNTITVRHLITHRSGILDYENLMDENGAQVLDAGVLDLLKKTDSTYFKPGASFRYSNSAYALMALITERVSGMSYAAFVKQRIFRPLKMSNSLVYEANTPIKKRAMGFARNAQGLYPRDQSAYSAVQGDGGVYTSLNDYNKWTHAIWNNTLVDMQATLRKLNEPIRQVTGSYYGPGWFYFDKGEPALFHSGSTCGFSTFSVNIPGQKTSIVYLSNIAGNTAPFRSILELLAREGIANPSKVFELHELTR